MNVTTDRKSNIFHIRYLHFQVGSIFDKQHSEEKTFYDRNKSSFRQDKTVYYKYYINHE